MYIATLKRYKREGTKYLRDLTLEKAIPKLVIIVNSVIKKTGMYKIKEDLFQESIILFYHYLEKLQITNRNDFQIKAYIENSTRKDLYKKINIYMPKRQLETKTLNNIADERININKELYKKDILRLLEKIEINPLHKKIFIDYFQNHLKRRELRKKYSLNRSKLDYIIENTRIKLKKYTQN